MATNKVMLPANRPLKAGVKKYLDQFPEAKNYKVLLVGVRGYFKNTMGNPDSNDIGIYDDAIFLVTPKEVLGYNANTDPSISRNWIATLKEGGPYLYKIGLHGISRKNPYKALRQFGPVTVFRNGHKNKEFTDTPAARFYINIHKGGFGTTSSEGCQTIHPTQWNGFIKLVEGEMKAHKQDIIPYFLGING